MATSAGARPRVSGILFALLGAVLAIGGSWLVALGGSWYYLIAGSGLIATGLLLIAGRASALVVYGVVLIGTLVWAMAEVGLSGWELEPRLVGPMLLGLYLLMPWVTRGLDVGADGTSKTGSVRRAMIAPVLGVLATVLIGAVAFSHPVGIEGSSQARRQAVAEDASVPPSDWGFYGRTPLGDRFAPLNQITPANVHDLKVAWTFETGDRRRPGEDKGGTDAGHEFNFENTPLKIDDTLYVCTGHSWVEAIDARTGKLRWKTDPHADTKPDVYLACRGVAYYVAPAGLKTPCPRRIIAPVLDARIMALNADTGAPCADFGRNGFIDMKEFLGHVPAGFHFITSPPLVLHDRLITRGWIYDNQARNEPSGAVRAYDPITGKLAWAWDLGADPQVQHPAPNQQLTRGTPNAWGVYTADPALSLVYLPLGNATPDYYNGARRPFDDQYNSSTVALDIATGEPRWHFQTTHRDVWDMDLPIGPSMVDVPTPNGIVPALVQTTKRGEFFMLDRRTGVPIAQVVEKRVPTAHAAPGEIMSPTQPYSVGLPSLTPKDLTEAHMWGATPIDQMMCRIQFRQASYAGQFTPPDTRNTIVYPAFDGIIDWHGASIDPERKLLFANASYIPFIIKEVPRHRIAKGDVPPWNGQGDEPKIKPGLSPQYGTPYVGSVHPWLNPLKVPCNPPPWGTMTAIDLTSRKIVWQHPLGTTRDTGPFGTHNNLPLPTGIFNIGGGMVTRGGLIFIGATADDYLRALDENTGKVLWKARLPAGGQANPISYSVDGKQYVLIAAGGHSGLGTRTGDYLMAYALP